jgi:mercuric reductase
MSNAFTSNKLSKYSADVIVIGAGAAGTVAAQIISNSGQKVILVEDGKLGGDCVNYSCIPTKSLIESSNLYYEMSKASLHGIDVSSHELNFTKVLHAQKKAITATGINVTENNYGGSVKVVKGHAHFLDNHTITVGLNQFSAKKFIIASGSTPLIPNISGIEEIDYLTYRNFHDLNKPPKSVAIIGGGSVAYEYAQILRAFGSSVHIFEHKDHILNNFDPEVSDIAENLLLNKGIKVSTKSNIVSVSKTANGITLTYKNAGQTNKLRTHSVMIACGKTPNADLGLENAGVTYTKDGINVNKSLRTNQKHIYAIGDVTGKTSSASAAIISGQTAAHNILHRKKIQLNVSAIPSVVYGDPEIAVVGVSEKAIMLTGMPYQTSITPLGVVGKSYTKPYQDGFVKIIASHYGTIIGASIVAPHASELIAELALTVRLQRRACDISGTAHVFGSWSEAIRVAASKIQCI